MTVRLKQLASESAVAGQAVTWDGVAGIWVPSRPAVAHARIESAAIVGSTSGSYADGFAGASVSPPEDGDYIAEFEGEVTGTSNSNIPGIAIGLDSTTVSVTQSERDPEVGNGLMTALSSVFLPGLLVSNTVHGILRRTSGAGTSGLIKRSLALYRVIS